MLRSSVGWMHFPVSIWDMSRRRCLLKWGVDVATEEDKGNHTLRTVLESVHSQANIWDKSNWYRSHACVRTANRSDVLRGCETSTLDNAKHP